MRRIFLLICAAMAAFLIVFIVPAFAIGQLFSISGQVIDATGGPVGGANVTLINNNYEAIAVRTTNANGSYDFVNVNSSTDAVSVRVSLTEKGKTYKVPSYYTRWYPAQGTMTVPKDETQFADYPEPTLGYAYGAILSGASADAKFVTGDVYMTSVNTGVQYHEVAIDNDGKGSFYFHVPPGDYEIYATHEEKGIKSRTTTERITVVPAWSVDERLPVKLVITHGIVPLHMMPQIGASPLSGLTVPQAGRNEVSLLPLLLSSLLGLIVLAGLYLTIKRF